MTTPQAKVEHGWRYDAAGRAAFDLEALLKRHNITISSGSIFEKHVLSVLGLVELKNQSRPRAIEEDLRPHYRTLIGVYEIATLLLAVQHSPQFSALVPHLRLLNDGAVLQNQPSPGRDDATNKLFELYMGAVALQCGEGVVLDDPTSSKGDNPDVLVTLGGRRWGIAC